MNKIDISKIYSDKKDGSNFDLDSLKSKASSLMKYSPALLLAGVVPAQAQVICNDGAAPITLSGTYFASSTTYVDMDGDGNDDFAVAQRTSFFFSGLQALMAPLAPGNSFIVEPNAGSSYSSVANLSYGDPINAGENFNTYFRTLAYPAFNWGLFQAPNNGYAGVSFQVAGNTHYGWIELTTDATSLTIEGFCYESTPNAAITAGTRGAIVPTVGEWGLICLNLLLMIFGVTAVKQRGTLALVKSKK